jgi:hypothetical protein
MPDRGHSITSSARASAAGGTAKPRDAKALLDELAP